MLGVFFHVGSVIMLPVMVVIPKYLLQTETHKKLFLVSQLNLRSPKRKKERKGKGINRNMKYATKAPKNTFQLGMIK